MFLFIDHNEISNWFTHHITCVIVVELYTKSKMECTKFE